MEFRATWGEFADVRHPEKGRYLIIHFPRNRSYKTNVPVKAEQLPLVKQLYEAINKWNKGWSRYDAVSFTHLYLDAFLKKDYEPLTKVIKTWVYLVSVDGSDLIKIGTAINPWQRLRTFTVTLPFDLNFKIIAVGPNLSEKFFHDKYSNKRVRGEWFDIRNELDSIIEEYNFWRL